MESIHVGTRPSRISRRRALSVAARTCATITMAICLLAGCSRSTGRLSAETARRLEHEGILRRADDLLFRYTHRAGEGQVGWEEWTASIVLTRRSLLVHVNEKARLEITAEAGDDYRVRRDHDRIVLRAETSRSSRSWSFRPPEDAEGWTHDLRAMLKGSADSTGVGD